MPLSSPIRYTSLLALLSTVIMSGCSTYRDIPANSRIETVVAKMGEPSHRCTRADGSSRLVWSTQPSGQYAYGVNVSPEGIADKVESLLNDSYFKRLDTGVWTQNDVACEFGPPALTERMGLGEKQALIWTYRYKQNNVWNNLLHIYFGRDGERVTHYHSAPDPRYEREYPEFWLFP